jgi:hypothetical protein
MVARRRGRRCPAVERTEEDEDAFSSASTDQNGKLGRAAGGLAWWAGLVGCVQVKFSSFFLSCFSFLFSCFLFYDSNSILNSVLQELKVRTLYKYNSYITSTICCIRKISMCSTNKSLYIIIIWKIGNWTNVSIWMMRNNKIFNNQMPSFRNWKGFFIQELRMVAHRMKKKYVQSFKEWLQSQV